MKCQKSIMYPHFCSFFLLWFEEKGNPLYFIHIYSYSIVLFTRCTAFSQLHTFPWAKSFCLTCHTRWIYHIKIYSVRLIKFRQPYENLIGFYWESTFFFWMTFSIHPAVAACNRLAVGWFSFTLGYFCDDCLFNCTHSDII